MYVVYVMFTHPEDKLLLSQVGWMYTSLTFRYCSGPSWMVMLCSPRTTRQFLELHRKRVQINTGTVRKQEYTFWSIRLRTISSCLKAQNFQGLVPVNGKKFIKSGKLEVLESFANTLKVNHNRRQRANCDSGVKVNSHMLSILGQPQIS